MSIPMLYPMDSEKQKKVEVLYSQALLLKQNGLKANSLTVFYAALSAHFFGVDSIPSSTAQLVFEAVFSEEL